MGIHKTNPETKTENFTAGFLKALPKRRQFEETTKYPFITPNF